GSASMVARLCGLSCANLGHSDLLGIFVIAQSKKDGLSQLLVGSQFLVGNLRDQLRRQIGDVALARRIGKRGRVPDQRLKFLVEGSQGFMVKSRSDFAQVEQLAIFVSPE